jgi:hypothetical protein
MISSRENQIPTVEQYVIYWHSNLSLNCETSKRKGNPIEVPSNKVRFVYTTNLITYHCLLTVESYYKAGCYAEPV